MFRAELHPEDSGPHSWVQPKHDERELLHTYFNPIEI